MRRTLLLLTALAALLVAASPAAARGRDSDRDKMPDRWEKRHGLKVKKKDARRDRDRDGLINIAEYRAKMDPRDADSDDDGETDGEERPGTVDSYEDGVLTIRLFDGSTLSGKVTDETHLKCKPLESAETSEYDEAGTADPDPVKPEPEPEPDPEKPEPEPDPEPDKPEPDDYEDPYTCPEGAVRPGVQVREAELRVGLDGVKVWRYLKLLLP